MRSDEQILKTGEYQFRSLLGDIGQGHSFRSMIFHSLNGKSAYNNILKVS